MRQSDTVARIGGDEFTVLLLDTGDREFIEGIAGNELTENVFLSDSEQLARNFAELREAGVQLALDDFGTGYSSLAYLKRFDVNFLKIDQSFVRGNEPGSNSHAIAETIILMAHKLGLQVVAEGVETVEQRDWLRIRRK